MAPGRPSSILWAALAAVVAAGVPAGAARAGSGLTLADLRGASYRIPDGTIPLSGGAYRKPYGDASGSALAVRLGDRQAFGDLDGDGRADGVTTVIVEPGGSGSFVYLAAVTAGDRALVSAKAALLGDRVRVDTLEIRDGMVFVGMRRHAPEDPLCCPTLGLGMTYELRGGELVPALSAPAAGQDASRVPASGSALEPTIARGSTIAPESAMAPEAAERAGALPPLSPLQEQVEAAPDGAAIVLEPGEYVLIPRPMVEPTCGNCEDPREGVPITVGLRLKGKGIRLVGAPDHRTVIRTRSGYGILVQDCEDCALEGLVVTGGVRDTSGRATDAAVVVQRSSVRIEGCRIEGNVGDSATVAATVVGIMGIAGREESRLEVRNNRILGNSWDGIALYRDAAATIEDNVIDGVDLAVGRSIGGGRGVGIGLTWNAQAEVRGNLVRRYWKGIGIFVDARATVEENVVEHIATWGLALWDAGRGRPQGFFEANVVDSTGACGAMIARSSSGSPAAGSFLGNALLRTGQNPKYDTGEPYCMQRALALQAAPPVFPVEGNLFLGNREGDGRKGSFDQNPVNFERRVRPLILRLARWESTRESAFYRRYADRGRP